jgi:uncharacterized protein (TIGR02001 family)
VNFRHSIACGCGVAWLLASAPLHAHEFHGYLTLVTDYVFRGASQSNGDPAVQAGIDYVHPGGLFAGVFVAGTDFPENAFGSNPGRLELDAYLGYSRAAGRDWSWDIAALRYDFPDSTGFDYAYDELAANLHFRDVLRLGATLSDNAGAGGSSGWTAEVELRHPLGGRFQLSGSLGHYEFARSDWSDYFYWDLGISATASRFTFDARYFGMDSGRAGFAGPQLTGSRLVGSVSVSF